MEKKWLKRINCIFLCIIFLLILNMSVLAAGRNIIENHDVVLPEGQMVENMFIIGGNASISGSVHDALIVVNGNLKIREKARIKGLILVVGGKIEHDPGAQISENVLNINFNEPVMSGLSFGTFFLMLAWFLRLGLTLLIFIIPVIIILLLRGKLDSFTLFIHNSPLRLIIIGLVSSILILAVSLLSVITIFGIPIAVVLLIISLISFFWGIAVIVRVIGEKLLDNKRYLLWQKAVAGSLTIAAAVNIPFLGLVFLLILFWSSLGIIITRYWDKTKF